MKLHYMGRFDGNADALPHGEHKPGAVKFKEVKDARSMAILGNTLSLFIIAALAALAYLRLKNAALNEGFRIGLMLGAFASLLTFFPHELLHAVCFKGDVSLYTNFRQGMLFVCGTEDMSKARFVFLSLLPNLVFGFVPFLIAMLFPSCAFLLSLGILSIGSGAGDYYNVFNALTQMPKGARTYMHGFNSYWYMP